jgi:hypothetical protein
MVGEFNFLHDLLPKYSKSIWRMSMREVGSYLRKIDAYFRIDEIKIEAKECKLDLAGLEDENFDVESTDFLIKMDRIAHETKYNLFLKSSATMIYSTFENSLLSVAQAVSDVTDVKCDVRKYKKKSSDERFLGGIGTYALYLMEVHKVEWDGLEEMWGRIDKFRFVRNRIVHEGGALDVSDFELFDEISGNESGLSRDEEIISIEFFYLTQIFELMKDFFDALCLRLDGRVFIR